MSTDSIVKYFSRHIVPINFVFQNTDEVQNIVITTFVLSVSNHWFLVTAGHCIRGINDIIDSELYNLVSCQLIDSLGIEALDPNPVPFAYDSSKSVYLSENYPFDYGVMPLSPYYKQALQANNVVPLNEDVWKSQPYLVDSYYLLGIPSELIRSDSDAVEIVQLLVPVQAIDEKPEGFDEVDAPLFYGRVILDDTINSIKGMSGGPIFAFHKNEEGEVRYF